MSIQMPASTHSQAKWFFFFDRGQMSDRWTRWFFFCRQKPNWFNQSNQTQHRRMWYMFSRSWSGASRVWKLAKNIGSAIGPQKNRIPAFLDPVLRFSPCSKASLLDSTALLCLRGWINQRRSRTQVIPPYHHPPRDRASPQKAPDHLRPVILLGKTCMARPRYGQTKQRSR